MASFASPTELGQYLNVTLAGGDATQAQAMLDQATGEMKDYMQQSIVQVAETVTLDPPAGDGDTIVLPQFPVTAIASVTVDGVALSLPGDIRWYPDGRLRRDNGTWVSSWGVKRQSIVVNYTHGYTTVPDDLKAICKARAARLLDNPTGLTSDTAGVVSANYGTTAGDKFLKGEKETMDSYGDLVSA